MTIGVLALQGGVQEHRSALESLGRTTRAVRVPADLEGLSGIVLPGGESTTMTLLLRSAGLMAPLAARIAAGLPTFGTCAGLILLATPADVEGPVSGFDAIDLGVHRNGYGAQAASFEAELEVDGWEDVPLHAVFIRAPVVTTVGPEVEVLSRAVGPHGGPPTPVVCRQGPVLVAAFHPELTPDRRLHQHFLALVDAS